MNRFRWLVICVAAGIGVAAWGQKIDLKVNYGPGAYVATQHVTLSTTFDTGDKTIKLRTIDALTMDMTVGKADADSHRDLTFTFRRIKSDSQRDGKTTKTHDSATDAKPQDPVYKIDNAMIGQSMSMTVDAKGHANSLHRPEKLLAAMPKDVPEDEVTQSLQIHAENLLECFGQTALPGKPVGKGDSWELATRVTMPTGGSMHVRQVCTLKEIKNGVATVTGKATVKSKDDYADATEEVTSLRDIDMTTESTLLIDVATGLPQSATTTQKGSVLLSLGGKDVTVAFDGKSEITIQKGAYKGPQEAPKKK